MAANRQNSRKNKNGGDNNNGNGNGRKKNKSRGRLFIKTFLITTLILAALIFSGGVFLLNWIKPPEIAAQSADDSDLDDDWVDVASIPLHADEADRFVGGVLIGAENFSSSDRKKDFYTFLIFGTDKVGYNTDTIMVASYDAVNKAANIISIPRDTLVNVKRTVKKINAAYGAGFLYEGGHEGGIDQLKREISTLIGFLPDYYVMINLNAFVKIVDAVGGIDIYNPYNMNYDASDQDLYIHIPKGQHHLYGEEALKFARYREGNNNVGGISDLQRIENQQTVINAVLEKVLKPENIAKIPEFIDIFNENVSSDLETENMLWFAAQINEIRGTEALNMYTLPSGGSINHKTRGWYSYLDEAAVLELVNRTINPYTKDIEAGNLNIITALP